MSDGSLWSRCHSAIPDLLRLTTSHAARRAANPTPRVRPGHQKYDAGGVSGWWKGRRGSRFCGGWTLQRATSGAMTFACTMSWIISRSLHRTAFCSSMFTGLKPPVISSRCPCRPPDICGAAGPIRPWPASLILERRMSRAPPLRPDAARRAPLRVDEGANDGANAYAVAARSRSCPKHRNPAIFPGEGRL